MCVGALGKWSTHFSVLSISDLMMCLVLTHYFKFVLACLSELINEWKSIRYYLANSPVWIFQHWVYWACIIQVGHFGIIFIRNVTIIFICQDNDGDLTISPGYQPIEHWPHVREPIQPRPHTPNTTITYSYTNSLLKDQQCYKFCYRGWYLLASLNHFIQPKLMKMGKSQEKIPIKHAVG